MNGECLLKKNVVIKYNSNKKNLYWNYLLLVNNKFGLVSFSVIVSVNGIIRNN